LVDGWIDVAPYCRDPELEGVEIGDKTTTTHQR
jgi:hypothetical protein